MHNKLPLKQRPVDAHQQIVANVPTLNDNGPLPLSVGTFASDWLLKQDSVGVRDDIG